MHVFRAVETGFKVEVMVAGNNSEAQYFMKKWGAVPLGFDGLVCQPGFSFTIRVFLRKNQQHPCHIESMLLRSAFNWAIHFMFACFVQHLYGITLAFASMFCIMFDVL